MSEAGHHEAMHRAIADSSPSLDDSAIGYWPRETADKSDTPPYTTDDIFVAFAKAFFIFWLAIVSAIMVAGGGAWLFTTFMDWAAPYWPLMANALGAL